MFECLDPSKRPQKVDNRLLELAGVKAQDNDVPAQSTEVSEPETLSVSTKAAPDANLLSEKFKRYLDEANPRAGTFLAKAKAGGYGSKDVDDTTPSGQAINRALKMVEQGIAADEAATRVGIAYSVLEPYLKSDQKTGSVKTGPDKYEQMAKDRQVSNKSDDQMHHITGRGHAMNQSSAPTPVMIPIQDAVTRLKNFKFQSSVEADAEGRRFLYVDGSKAVPVTKANQVDWALLSTKQPLAKFLVDRNDRRRRGKFDESENPDFLAEFLKEYGTHGLGLLVKEFIGRAPEFRGDGELAKEIGRAMANLESALVQLSRSKLDEARLSFEDWCKEVDKIVSRKHGISADDGVDWPSRDWYEDGFTPEQAAKKWRRYQENEFFGVRRADSMNESDESDEGHKKLMDQLDKIRADMLDPNSRRNQVSIEIDCPPGNPRPDDLLPGVLKDTGLDPSDFDCVSRSFGNWTWVLKEVSPEKDEIFKKSKPTFKERLTKLHQQGTIRYASW